MENIELFSARVCPFAHRSRLALIEKKLPFSLVDIDLNNKPDWFYDINPDGTVPALRQGDFLLNESLVINEYINDCATDPPLLPDDPQQRAQARYWISYFGTNFVPLFYRLMTTQDDQKQRDLTEQLYQLLKVFDLELQRPESAGPYWFGRQAGLVDIAVYPWFERWPVLTYYRDVEIPPQLAALRDWVDSMQVRDAVRRAGEDADFYIDKYRDYATGRK